MKRRKIVTSGLGTLDALIINIIINTITRRRFDKGHLFTAHLRETLDPARAFTSSLTPPATRLMLIMMVTIVVTIIVVVVIVFGLGVPDTRPPSPIIVMMTIMNVFSLIISIVELGPS